MRVILTVIALCLWPALATAEQVGNLNAKGDNYLSLRARPSTKGKEISQMGAGTALTILERDGDWRKVRTSDGREGWAHSKYIVADPKPNRAEAQVLAPVASPPPVADTATPRVLAPMASGPADLADPLDWVQGHMAQFHDPLRYYP